MAKTNKVEIGISGEYYAAARLSAMGYKVSLALGNTKDFDLFVANGGKSKMVQVKTTEGPKAEWVVPMFAEANPNLVFVFVNLNPRKECTCPCFHIAPSKTVKKQLDDKDAAYIAKRQKQGNPVKKGIKGVSRFSDNEGKYLEKWHFLGL